MRIALLTVSATLSAPTPAAQIRSAGPGDEPEHALEIENERVLIYRIRLDPGDSLPVHTHQHAWASVTIRGPQPGVTTWHEAGDANPVAAGMYPLEVVTSVLMRIMFPTFSRIQDDKEQLGRAFLRTNGAIALVSFPTLFGRLVDQLEAR